MMNSWEERQRSTLLDGRRALERTSESLARSERTALETEAIGVEVVSNLSTQRETLQRARNRLEDIDQGLSQTQSILNTMTRRVFTNKLLLILIIICECGILGSMVYLKFIRFICGELDLNMSDEFSQSILLKVVAQICQMVGFHNIMTTPLHFLTDLLRSSIIQLGQTAQHYAEHCGRSCINLNDLSLAFYDSGIRPSELTEFLRTVKPLPKCIVVSKYPITKHEPTVSCDEPQRLQENQLNYDNEPRETLKIKISLSKIKAASKLKKNKSSRNKKKKKKKHSRS